MVRAALDKFTDWQDSIADEHDRNYANHTETAEARAGDTVEDHCDTVIALWDESVKDAVKWLAQAQAQHKEAATQLVFAQRTATSLAAAKAAHVAAAAAAIASSYDNEAAAFVALAERAFVRSVASAKRALLTVDAKQAVQHAKKKGLSRRPSRIIAELVEDYPADLKDLLTDPSAWVNSPRAVKMDEAFVDELGPAEVHRESRERLLRAVTQADTRLEVESRRLVVEHSGRLEQHETLFMERHKLDLENATAEATARLEAELHLEEEQHTEIVGRQKKRLQRLHEADERHAQELEQLRAQALQTDEQEARDAHAVPRGHGGGGGGGGRWRRASASRPSARCTPRSRSGSAKRKRWRRRASRRGTPRCGCARR